MQIARRLAWGIAGGLCLASPLSAEQPTTQQLIDRVDALQAEVKQLKAEQQQMHELLAAQSSTARRVEANALRHDRLVDLETFTAGYMPQRGFMLRSDNGDFMLHPLVVFQFRNETTYRQRISPAEGGDTQNGFEVRRVKFGVDGNVFSQNVTYQFIWSVDRHGGNVSMEDAWARFRIPDSSLYIRAGQIRDPLDHEQILFAPFLLTVERSLVDNFFASVDGLVQGVSLGYENSGPIRAEFAVTDGLRSENTNFENFPAAGNESDWGVAGRIEWKPLGTWKQYSAMTALGAKKPLLVFGAGADYTEAGDTQQLTHVIDVQTDCPCGFSFYGAYLGRYVNHNGNVPGTNGQSTSSARTSDTYDSTLRLEAGFLVTPRLEPFVRYEYIHFDPSELPATAKHSVINEFTLGCNYYIYEQRARISADISYLPDGSPFDDDGSGVLHDDGTNEVVIRAQFQLIL